MSIIEPWIGVDLDGTLAEYHGWVEGEIGKPIPLMVERVKRWFDEGENVKIFTARAAHADEAELQLIRNWCEVHLGRVLEITCCKDYGMTALYDDRAVQIVPNTGLRADGVDDSVGAPGDIGEAM